MNIEIIKNIRNKNIKEKFPNVKAIVQNDDFKDEHGYYFMTIEQAFELRKIYPYKKFFVLKDEPYYDYIKSNS